MISQSDCRRGRRGWERLLFRKKKCQKKRNFAQPLDKADEGERCESGPTSSFRYFFCRFFLFASFFHLFFAWQRRGVFIHFAFSRIGQSEIGKVFFFCFFLKKKPISSTRFHRKASRSKKKKKKKEIERPIGDGNRTRTKLGGKKKCKKKKKKKKKLSPLPPARAQWRPWWWWWLVFCEPNFFDLVRTLRWRRSAFHHWSLSRPMADGGRSRRDAIGQQGPRRQIRRKRKYLHIDDNNQKKNK